MLEDETVPDKLDVVSESHKILVAQDSTKSKVCIQSWQKMSFRSVVVTNFVVHRWVLVDVVDSHSFRPRARPHCEGTDHQICVGERDRFLDFSSI